MSNKFKNIDIKNSTYYFFNDITNTKNFDPNKIKIDTLIYYFGYVTIKDLKYVKSNSVNPSLSTKSMDTLRSILSISH